MRRRRRERASARGLTLLEVMVSIGILALVSSLIYGALDGMSKSRTGIERMDERYQQGRSALMRLSREVQAAFVSLHEPLVVSQSTRATAFVGKHGSPADRLDFTSFSHRRLARDTHESDQNELGYFGARNPDAGGTDLVRREAKIIDLEPTKGGVVNVVVEDIQSFSLEYLDPLSTDWTEDWDSTQAAGQYMRLPLQVKITLVLNGGPGGQPITLRTKAPVGAQGPLSFAVLQR
jgi:general secretion pathway protein J